MNRIDARFTELRKQNRKALIAFVTPGIPTLGDTPRTALGLEDAGCDILEIGIPFSDPVADGPVIQAASDLALRSGVTPPDVLAIAARIRERSRMPLLLLLYYNTIFRCGVGRFAADCRAAGVDGLIVPDLPFEQRDELLPELGACGVRLITLACPSSGRRLETIVPSAEGFVYCVSASGVTGERDRLDGRLAGMLETVGRLTRTPRAVGFGISSPEQVMALKPLCEGVIAGSAVVRRLMEEGEDSACAFAASLRAALDGE